MSIDQLNRVVVGSGHFMEGALRFADGLERAIDLTTRVQVSSGSFNPSDRLFRAANAIDPLTLMPTHATLGRRVLPMSEVMRFLDANGIPRPIIKASDIESSAWQKYMDQLPEHTKEGLKELALSYGCAASGDIQGALEHGLNGTIECAQQVWENFKSTWNGGVDRE
jgi:hypothetical protein